MTTEQDKAVALAEKHGWFVTPNYVAAEKEKFTAMLADHEQQVIQRLVDESGVMPVVMCVAGDLQDDVPVITEDRVRKAIASLQAKHEARVRELEKDAARYRWLCDNSYDREGVTQLHVWKHWYEPHSETGEQTAWEVRLRGPTSIDAAIDEAISAKKDSHAE